MPSIRPQEYADKPISVQDSAAMEAIVLAMDEHTGTVSMFTATKLFLLQKLPEPQVVSSTGMCS
jgi:hypothetical protein